MAGTPAYPHHQCHIPKGQQTPFRWRPASPAGDKDVDRDLDMLRQAETRKVTRRLDLTSAGRRNRHSFPPATLKRWPFYFQRNGENMTTLIDTLLVWAFAALLLVVPQYIETLF